MGIHKLWSLPTWKRWGKIEMESGVRVLLFAKGGDLDRPWNIGLHEDVGLGLDGYSGCWILCRWKWWLVWHLVDRWGGQLSY